ncbi:MAG: hypothetical protein RI973_547 [Bacteroidota bacterium]|jgi:hypothetical protein
MRNNQSLPIEVIYFNALPYYQDRVDITIADETKEAFAGQFLKDLFSGRLSLQANAAALSADRLRHIYFQSRNHEKTFGARAFGFGYPLFIDIFNGELVVAPVFIWQISIEAALNRTDAWVLKYSDHHQVQPNYQFLALLREKYGLERQEEMHRLSRKHPLDVKSLLEFCSDISGRLQAEENGTPGELVPAPGIDVLGEFGHQPSFCWSGVLSLFPPQHHRNWNAHVKPEEAIVPKPPVENPESFIFPWLPADPEQQSALELVHRHPLAVVEGEDAYGRTQTLVNLIINALSNGKKCLVVSERAPALKYTQQMLARTGLHQLHFLLTDAWVDKGSMLELLRIAAKGLDKETSHLEDVFQEKKNKYLREKSKADAAYSASKAKVFGDQSWTETVGLFLSSNRMEGKELLSSQLSPLDFDYNAQEYESLRRGIVVCQPLFNKINTLVHPLSNLHSAVFENKTSAEALQFVKLQLKNFLEKATALHYRYIAKSDDYLTKLKEQYEQHASELSAIIQLLEDKINLYGDRFGSDFRQAGTRSFELPVFFSARKKQILKARQEIAQGFNALENAFSERPYFEFHFQPCKGGTHIPRTSENVQRFAAALRKWEEQLDWQLQDEMLHLNSKTASPNLDLQEQISALEYSLDLLIGELNDSGLYQKKLENKTLTIPQRQKYLEAMIEQLELTQLNLRDFDLFYVWQTAWLALGVKGQKLIRALVKVKPKDWVAAFESWYFGNLLGRHQSVNLPQGQDLPGQVASAWHELKPLVLPQLLALWQQKQKQELKQLKKKNKKGYQLLFDKNNHKYSAEYSLEAVLKEGFDAVTTFLPVLFVTPHQALNVLPQVKGYFDFVLFDEAGKFPIEPATVLLASGKSAVAFGRNDSYGNETSLIQYALENEVPCAGISNRYQAPSLYAHGIYSQSEGGQGAPEYQVDSVEGRFHETECVNDVEAQYIIRLLNQIRQTPQRVFPAVGIITLSVEQRDLISFYLLRLKQQNSLAGEKILQLERNGMGVYFIDDIVGHQFDQIILSCTYGVVNLKGSLTRKITQLNTPVGIANLRMLANKPLQSLRLVHSLPEEQIQRFEGRKWEEGTWLLANLIRLAEAGASKNYLQQLQALESLGIRPNPEPQASRFVLEVKNALRPYIAENRFSLNYLAGEVRIPLLLKSWFPDQCAVVLHPDGFFGDMPFTSFVWEQAQRDKITALGMDYLPIWSTAWLKNPAREARLLASRIIKQDSQNKSLEEETDEASAPGELSENQTESGGEGTSAAAG